MKSYRRDGAGIPIPGGSSVVKIQNNWMTSSQWETVKVTVDCKAILAKMRSGNPWQVRVVGHSEYITLDDALSIDIAKKAGENLFQVRPASGSDTFELMLLD